MEIIPIRGIPEITTETSLPQYIWRGVEKMESALKETDILVIASKAVAKWKGYVFRERDVIPSPIAKRISPILQRSPEYCQIVLNGSEEIVRLAPGVLITRTTHGFVMANAGVDASNTAHPDEYIVLPPNLDELAEEIRNELFQLSHVDVAIIISDTFGRPWRNGQTDLAVGCAGLEPLLDLRGTTDDIGQPLNSTLPAVADELAAAADLVAEKTGRIPAVLIRGYHYAKGKSGASCLVMDKMRDLFGPETEGVRALAQLMLRRSVRIFSPRKIPEELLKQILAAGQAAPSAHGNKPWNFSVIADDVKREAFLRALAHRHRHDMESIGLSEDKIKQRLAHSCETLGTAAALIIISARDTVPHNPLAGGLEAERILTIQSAALAGGQMLLAATFLGLGACWYAAPLFCSDLVQELLNLPEGYTPQGMLAMGYPAQISP